MAVIATAPGKLALLGEYAVLHGAPALVMAVDRRCLASIASRSGDECTLETRFPDARLHKVATHADSVGVPLIDVVRSHWPCEAQASAWSALLDSTAFYDGETKFGFGSSAAALVAFAGAWSAWGGHPLPTLDTLVALHRRFQGGAGSGLDVAASLLGGIIRFQLEPDASARATSVTLPSGVEFACLFTGKAASTPDFVGRYHAWRAERPADAAQYQCGMQDDAEAGCAATREGDARGLLAAIGRYGEWLDRLGHAVGIDIVSEPHRVATHLARRFGVVYKVSGAGGGDVGIALADDSQALTAFVRAAIAQGCARVDISMENRGLQIEEQTQ